MPKATCQATNSFRFFDPEALSLAIRDANLQPCQISAKALPSMVARVNCPGLCFDYAALGPAMLFTGMMSRDCYTLVFVKECPEMGRSFNFGVEHRDGFIGFFPPGGMLDAYTPEGYENVSLAVPVDLFQYTVEKMFPEIPERVLRQGASIRVDSKQQTVLRQLIHRVIDGIDNPENPLAELIARKHLQSELLDVFLIALRDGILTEKKNARMEKRFQRLKTIRDFLAAKSHEAVKADSLCRELGLSRRGLEVMFQESLGIGPMKFLRHQRLHRVRRALQATSPLPGAIKKAALDCGFWHMGHFGQEYRALFGENPSETLRSTGRPMTFR
jgi:AraC-like DNA-binding protein